MTTPVCESVQIGNCTLFCGDALALLPLVSHADCVIADPPYGTAFDYTKDRSHRQQGLKFNHQNGNRPFKATPQWLTNFAGDTTPFDPTPWLSFRQIILWGAHNYASRLPDSRGWLVWDKREGTTSDSHGDCELAWTNLPLVVRMHRQLWRGVLRAGEENAVHGAKCHPAQKPIALMRWCVGKTQDLVLDPYMGSGSTGLACLELGRPFLGIEIDRHYFEIACRRIAEAYRQLPLLLPPVAPSTPHQLALQEASP